MKITLLFVAPTVLFLSGCGFALTAGPQLEESLAPNASAQYRFPLPEVRSAHVGVYTEEQAEAGAEVYTNVCSNCHNPTNPLSGDEFLRRWSGNPLWRLYEFISTRMPYGNGGMLPPEQYNAVVAYVLRENGYPAGDTPLPQTPLEIAHINLDPHPEESDAP